MSVSQSVAILAQVSFAPMCTTVGGDLGNLHRNMDQVLNMNVNPTLSTMPLDQDPDEDLVRELTLRVIDVIRNVSDDVLRRWMQLDWRGWQFTDPKDFFQFRRRIR